MLGYWFGVSQYPQFYAKDLDMYQLLPRPYIGSFDGFPGDKLILKMGVRLGKSSRNVCLWVYWNQDNNWWYWKSNKNSILENFERKIEKAKKILLSTCRIGGDIFTFMAVIGGRLFSDNHKNLNHVHKDSKYLDSVIITLGKYISGGDTVFYDGVKSSDLGSRAHVL